MSVSTTTSHSNVGLNEPTVGDNNNLSRSGTETSNLSTSGSSDSSGAAQQQQAYPEQKHAGAVGFGPNYHQGPTMGDKITGIKEQLKGKITRNTELQQHGRDLKTGELQRKEQEKDDPAAAFSNPEDKEKKETKSSSGAGSADLDHDGVAGPTSTSDSSRVDDSARAATVDAEGTRAAERQRQGGNEEGQRTIG